MASETHYPAHYFPKASCGQYHPQAAIRKSLKLLAVVPLFLGDVRNLAGIELDNNPRGCTPLDYPAVAKIFSNGKCIRNLEMLICNSEQQDPIHGKGTNLLPFLAKADAIPGAVDQPQVVGLDSPASSSIPAGTVVFHINRPALFHGLNQYLIPLG